MNKYRFLFHIHTFKSYDATITYNQLYKIIIKYNITHIAITEHNNIDSYIEFKNFLSKKKSTVVVIPSVEYTTKVGDIIALNIDEMISFENYKDLIIQIKERKGLVILPHPFKRKKYPNDLIKNLDFYEIINMRGISKSFDSEIFNNVKQIYGSDAHNFIELPGIINTFSHNSKDVCKALQASAITPCISNSTLINHRFINKIISKIKRKFFK